jgi:hypothetical protein
MEWKASWLNEPPRDGSWIISMSRDFSGANILSFRCDCWYNASGEADLFEDEDFALSSSCWAELPAWMLPWLDAQGVKQADVERHERWQKEREARK